MGDFPATAIRDRRKQLYAACGGRKSTDYEAVIAGLAIIIEKLLMAVLRRNLSGYFRPVPPSLRIGSEINRGAYGTVHEGELDGRPVAVKKIHRLLLEAASGEKDTWERVVRDFEEECRLLEGRKHPHIVGFSGAYYDVRSEEPILVMERMKENLRDLLDRKGQLSFRRQLQICLEIAIGLEFLHNLSPPTVHRDLNDKNVMLSEEARRGETRRPRTGEVEGEIDGLLQYSSAWSGSLHATGGSE